MLQFSSESGGFCRIPVTEWDICCGSTGQREGGGCSFFDSTGGAWRPVWRRWWLERYGWSLVQFLIFSSFLSPHGIVFLFYFYSIQPSLCWLTPFFWSFFFLEGTNGEWVSLQWCFGSVSLLGGSLWAEVARSRIITSFCCSIRPMFSVTCGLNCFLSIIVSHFCLFCFYFLQQIFMLLLLYLVSKEIFHLGGLIFITHTNVYMSFTEWEWYCFFSFFDYSFEIVNVWCIL